MYIYLLAILEMWVHVSMHYGSKHALWMCQISKKKWTAKIHFLNWFSYFYRVHVFTVCGFAPYISPVKLTLGHFDRDEYCLRTQVMLGSTSICYMWCIWFSEWVGFKPLLVLLMLVAFQPQLLSLPVIVPQREPTSSPSSPRAIRSSSLVAQGSVVVSLSLSLARSSSTSPLILLQLL
jgi:hypothetical protein